MPMMNGNMPYGMPGAPNVAYDPHERILLPGGSMGVGTGRPQQQRAPLLPRHGEAGSAMSRKPGELPHIQDLTPEIPPEERLQQQQQQNVQGGEGYGMANPSMNPPDGMMPMPMAGDVDMAGPSMPPQRGGFRGHRGGGRGTFGGDAASFRPQKRNDKTLVVEKIPEEKLSLGSVNDWFKKFGTVTNVAVDAVGGKALVSFSTHDEAHAAWKSEDAVFGNRFVKVFWHRPKEGHGHMGTRMLAASAPLVANFSKDPSESAPAPSGPSTSSAAPTTSVRKHSTPSAASALAAKQHLLEQQIAEQKALMAKLGTASPEEKKDIMIRLRKLNEEMKAPTPSAPSKSQSPSPATPSAQKSSRDSTPRIDESKRKELLDKELELHNAVNGTGESEESTEELQAKLARLKAEAASMGLADSTAAESSHHATSGYRGGYRGRGRGARSYYRGAMRGGPPRGSMKLDNRPKKLLVKGVNEAQVQAVRDWYETTGQLDTLETVDGGDLVVSFKSRSAAEQGLSKGSSIATVGPVQISWYTSQHTNGTTIPKTPAAPGPIEPSTSTTSKSSETESITHVTEPLDDIPMQPSQEEEVGARGWGDDDGFGML
ncbi:hypothetical protein QCA50_001636 [Cerrena zonata]|uniref:RRM domain-containing protein n=1 Tax=Cerrena zonata TaxID=2478898 RepID=A0AAW0GXF9_9APHY